jgi:triacylglycerol lipase
MILTRNKNMTKIYLRLIFIGMTMALPHFAQAQIPGDIAAQLRTIGRVVNPPATAVIYAPRALDKEPYQGVSVQRDIVYGTDPRNLLDVFTPTATPTAPRKVFVFVHGGGFTRGDRRAPGSPFYDNLMMWAAKNNMIGVNMTYRFAPKDVYPSGAQDIGKALGWIDKNIAARGGDPKQLFLMGHSAGAAHVASYVADERLHPAASPALKGALMLSGLFSITPHLIAAEPPVKAYFGDDIGKFAERSAIMGLLKTRVPLWVAYAELDPPAFELQADILNQALCTVGRCPTFARFAGHSHMSEIYSINSDDATVSNAMLAFVKNR